MHKRDRKPHQQKLRRDRVQPEKHLTRTPRQDSGPFDVPPVALAHPLVAEQSLHAMHHLLEGKNFSNIDEANAFLATLTGHGLERALENNPPDNPKWRAQEIAYHAMGATSAPEAAMLARQALGLDPDCVDALCILAHSTCASEMECIAKLRAAVDLAERALGQKFIDENRGHFWSIMETRPYMRARLDLGMQLIEAGGAEEGITHLQALLDLNPNDNQGVRELLLPMFLLFEDLVRARELLARYPDEYTAIFNWGRTLERYLSGDLRDAQRCLAKARFQNPRVEKYLTGKRAEPRNLPASYSPGQESEARHCAFFLAVPWRLHPTAVQWLRTQ
jgi:tetratricopeptide (TPR) repeat protein